MIRTYKGVEPDIARSAYVDRMATVVGDVTLGPKTSVLPGAVLRGDGDPIVLEAGSNVQDNATVHEGARIGPYATVGHNAIVHAADVGERAMVGMGATVLDDTTIGERSLVGANSLVTKNTDVPPSVLVAGSPAETIREVEDSYWHGAADRYVERSRAHAETGEVVAEQHLPE